MGDDELSGETGGALDVLLTDAAVGPMRRWLPGRAGVQVAAGLATRPHKVVRRGAGLAPELAKVTVGHSGAILTSGFMTLSLENSLVTPGATTWLLPVPERLGGPSHEPLTPAPGSYVLED